MDYNKIFKDAFSDVTPLSDHYTICTNVKERAKNMKEKQTSKVGRPVAFAIAAAAIFAAATVTVGAVTGWNFNDAFGAIFGRQDTPQLEAGSTVSEPLVVPMDDIPVIDESEPFDFEKYGKTLDLWYDFEDYSLNVRAISADKTTAYLLYDVIFDADADFAPRDGWDDWWLFVNMDALEEGEEAAPVTRVRRSHCELISQSGSLLSFYGSMSLSDINDTLENKTITLDFGELFRTLPSLSEKDELPWRDRQGFDCGVHIEVPVDFPICTDGERYDINVPIELTEFSGEGLNTAAAQLVSFAATPFSSELHLQIDTSDYSKGDGPLIELSVQLEDGTVLQLNEGSSYNVEDGAVYYRSVFAVPIDPAEIAALDINGTVFGLK